MGDMPLALIQPSTLSTHCDDHGIVDPLQNEEPNSYSTPACLYELESTIRYLGIKVDDALEKAELTDA